jgi:hypothetical protein
MLLQWQDTKWHDSTLVVSEGNSGNLDRAVTHWTIAASGGQNNAMHHLITVFKHGIVIRESINSILTAYNKRCAETRSEARDAFIRLNCS